MTDKYSFFRSDTKEALTTLDLCIKDPKGLIPLSKNIYRDYVWDIDSDNARLKAHTKPILLRQIHNIGYFVQTTKNPRNTRLTFEGAHNIYIGDAETKEPAPKYHYKTLLRNAVNYNYISLQHPNYISKICWNLLMDSESKTSLSITDPIIISFNNKILQKPNFDKELNEYKSAEYSPNSTVVTLSDPKEIAMVNLAYQDYIQTTVSVQDLIEKAEKTWYIHGVCDPYYPW
jgi:hypothetical protein